MGTATSPSTRRSPQIEQDRVRLAFAENLRLPFQAHKPPPILVINIDNSGILTRVNRRMGHRAGKNGAMSRSWRDWWDKERGQAGTGGSHHRLIPAHAGNAEVAKVLNDLAAAHPRACGERSSARSNSVNK